MSHVQRSEIGRRARIESLIAQGEVPWYRPTPEQASVGKISEAQHAYELYVEKNDYEHVAREVNAHFHGGQAIRTRSSIRTALYRYRKMLTLGHPSGTT